MYFPNYLPVSFSIYRLSTFEVSLFVIFWAKILWRFSIACHCFLTRLLIISAISSLSFEHNYSYLEIYDLFACPVYASRRRTYVSCKICCASECKINWHIQAVFIDSHGNGSGAVRRKPDLLKKPASNEFEWNFLSICMKFAFDMYCLAKALD